MKIWTSTVIPFLAAAFALFFSAGCVPTSGFTVGGKVSGLSGQLVLSLNNSETLTVTKNGIYKFAAKFDSETSYNVSLVSQPPDQSCSITNGSGLVGSSNISNVIVSCGTDPAPSISAIWPKMVYGGGEIKISGSDLQDANTLYDGVEIAPNFRSSHELRFELPNKMAGNYLLTLVNDSGAVTASVNQGMKSTNAIQIATGEHHSCALMDEGSVYCWGLNGAGQAGSVPSDFDIVNPVKVYGIDNARQISVNGDHSCALLFSGVVKCWGDNTYGQLGNGERISSYIPVTVVGIDTAISIGTGVTHSCAVLSSGQVNCWGTGASRLGLGYHFGEQQYLLPVPVINVSNAISISINASRSCVLLNTGGVMCWGYFGFVTDSPDEMVHTPIAISNTDDAISISTGYSHSCAVTASSQVKCWGMNQAGQLGSGSTFRSEAAQVVNGLVDVFAVNSFFQRTCAVTKSGTVTCWGKYPNVLMEDGEALNSLLPMPIPGLLDVRSLSGTGSSYHAVDCTLLVSGEIKCWGDNIYGQLGIGTITDDATKVENPTTIRDLQDVVSYSAGETHSCTLLASGRVACWGKNSVGQLGNGSYLDSTYPVIVQNIEDAASISSGSYHSCALSMTGSVSCWGANPNYQLRVDTIPDSAIPIGLSEISGAVALAIDETVACAALSSGSILCWDYYGNEPNAPVVNIPGIASAVDVKIFRGLPCALLSEGTVQCWQVVPQGDTGAVWVSPLSVVEGLSDAISISASDTHACALRANGLIRCWGQNLSGQLGDRKINDGYGWKSVAVSGISNAVSVGAGPGYTCAVLETGLTKCWGNNSSGQLGDQTIIDSVVPVNVMGVTDAKRVIAGAKNSQHTCVIVKDGQVQCWGSNEHEQLTLPTRVVMPGVPVLFN